MIIKICITLLHDGLCFPVAFASKMLIGVQTSYATVEKECLATVWAIENLNSYLCRRTFTLQTDHQPLAYFSSAKMTNLRLMRWALKLNLTFSVSS